ncbi:MAG: type II toxin-antitoxin system ParD family antitoxin [Thermomicrobiales bacterium]
MNVRLNPSLEAMIQEKVESGEYGGASEVVEEALRFMAERDQRARQLKASVAKGFAQFEREESVELTPEHMELIVQRAAESAREKAGRG